MARASTLRWRVVTASVVALTLTAAALAVALTAVASARDDSRALSQRLVPAAASSVTLISLYSAQQSALRDYVTDGRSGALAPYRAVTAQIQREESQLAGLVRGYRAITLSLAATEAAQRAWLTHVAVAQLAAAARGDVTTAQAMQADVAHVRPYVLAIRAREAALQTRIAAAQQMTTDHLIHAHAWLLGALAGLCVVVAAFAAAALIGMTTQLLRPFRALRQAVDAVAHGQHGTRIPVIGPAELADLGRSTELMRTELVAALTEQERAEQRFRRLFDAAPDAMIAVGPDGSIVMANTRAVQLFGYPAPDLLGSPLEMLVPEKARDILAAERAEYFADLSRPIDGPLHMSALRRDGVTFPAEISLSGLLTENGMLVTAAIRDVSERLAMEAERERLRDEAERQRAGHRREQAARLESLGQLVGGVAHDFNNLLNVIQGYTDLTTEQVRELARDDERLEPILADIGQVGFAAEQAITLTRQLLTFAHHEVVRPEVFDLNAAARTAAQLLHRTIGEHIDLALSLDPAPCRIKADPNQIQQALVNLAVNGRDAMPGGGRLTIDTGSIDADDAYVASRPEMKPGRYIRLRVSDTGTGMDRATIQRVFEPFFTTKPKGRGTGLGLATVYGTITQAGGTVQVCSEPGLGTTFSVLLPATDEEATTRPAAVTPGDDDRGHGETILLVEDEESLSQLTSRILTRNGYRVCLAASGPDAVQRASDPAQAIDLLLTDVIMPGMLGNEVLARVRAARPHLPCLFMSGYARPILDSHGVTGPGAGILEKPFTETSLLTQVRQAISQAPAEQR